MCDVSEQAIEYATMNLRMNHVPVFGGVKVMK